MNRKQYRLSIMVGLLLGSILACAGTADKSSRLPSEQVKKPTLGLQFESAISLEVIGFLSCDNINESPGKRVGIKKGDHLTAVDNVPVEMIGELERILQTKEPGESVSVSVMREQVNLTFSFRLCYIYVERRVYEMDPLKLFQGFYQLWRTIRFHYL